LFQYETFFFVVCTIPPKKILTKKLSTYMRWVELLPMYLLSSCEQQSRNVKLHPRTFFNHRPPQRNRSVARRRREAVRRKIILLLSLLCPLKWRKQMHATFLSSISGPNLCWFKSSKIFMVSRCHHSSLSPIAVKLPCLYRNTYTECNPVFPTSCKCSSSNTF